MEFSNVYHPYVHINKYGGIRAHAYPIAPYRDRYREIGLLHWTTIFIIKKSVHPRAGTHPLRRCWARTRPGKVFTYRWKSWYEIVLRNLPRRFCRIVCWDFCPRLLHEAGARHVHRESFLLPGLCKSSPGLVARSRFRLPLQCIPEKKKKNK